MNLLVIAQRVELPAEAVWIRGAAVQLDRRPHLFARRLFENCVGIKRRVPFRQIEHIRKKSATRTHRYVFDGVLHLVVFPLIPVGAVRDDRAVAGGTRGGHPQRPENALVHKIAPWFPRDSGDDLGQRKVPDVAIFVFFSGRETEWGRISRLDHVEILLILEWVEARPFTDNPGSMSEQMPNGDPIPRLRRSIEVFADLVVEADLPLLGEQHNSRGDELFADRSDLKNSLGPRRDVMLDVRQTVAFGLNDLAFFDHG